MEPSKRPLFPGILLIALGVILLVSNIADYRLARLWPLLVVLPGLWFFYLFVRDKTNFGVLMPAAVLTVIGLLFLFCQYEGWYMMGQLWPVFIMAPGIGFLLMYLLGTMEKGFLIPGSILLGLGALFLGVSFDNEYLWPVILIVVGIVLLVAHRKEVRPAPAPGTGQESPVHDSTTPL